MDKALPIVVLLQVEQVVLQVMLLPMEEPQVVKLLEVMDNQPNTENPKVNQKIQ